MKPARIAVLAVALGAAGIAAAIMMRSTPPAPVFVQAPAAARTVDVLVAAIDLPLGQSVKAQDLKWQAWPADVAPTGAITREGSPQAQTEMAGALVRSNLLAGEPIRREKLVRADGSGFMAAILPSGMRAFAISIDTRGAVSAGGFILPNDRVDVLKVFRDDESSKSAGGDVQAADVVVPNVRVLAIGQTLQERNGEKVVVGDTATLELTPAQVETVALAQRTSQLSLTLRSLADARQVTAVREEKADAGVTVIRAGVGRTAPKR